MRIESPLHIRTELPLSLKAAVFIDNGRKTAANILLCKPKKLALLVGPCSIHDPQTALDYAAKLKKLSNRMNHFFLIMRIFLEKPRTHKGWKGLIYDPRLDGSNDISYGLKTSRKLLLEIAEMELPCATELLEPLAAPYFEDLITWGMIGARTSASQPHRILASSLSFPVGFKNGIDGDLNSAIHGILSAQDSHTHLSIDDTGYICAKKTLGNQLTHLVLRGSEKTGNYDPKSIAFAIEALKSHNLKPQLVIDCSHGNSQKDHTLQSKCFQSVISQIANGNENIRGLMLESHLFPGKQALGKPSALRYGVSITDACIGWEETESLIVSADEALSMSISSVQK
jgi:3-deoxy-7-phosphoheptulonate synthase